MLNPIKQIYKFNEEAGLLSQGYSDERECAFPIEEALEGFPNIEKLYSLITVDGEETIHTDIPISPKACSREIISYLYENLNGEPPLQPLADIDRLDKHLDIIIFSFGSIFKLGLTPQQAMNALDIVMQSNMSKIYAGQDSEGKQLKPQLFIGPETRLQKILDQRR